MRASGLPQSSTARRSLSSSLAWTRDARARTVASTTNGHSEDGGFDGGLGEGGQRGHEEDGGDGLEERQHEDAAQPGRFEIFEVRDFVAVDGDDFVDGQSFEQRAREHDRRAARRRQCERVGEHGAEFAGLPDAWRGEIGFVGERGEAFVEIVALERRRAPQAQQDFGRAPLPEDQEDAEEQRGERSVVAAGEDDRGRECDEQREAGHGDEVADHPGEVSGEREVLAVENAAHAVARAEEGDERERHGPDRHPRPEAGGDDESGDRDRSGGA